MELVLPSLSRSSIRAEWMRKPHRLIVNDLESLVQWRMLEESFLEKSELVPLEPVHTLG